MSSNVLFPGALPLASAGVGGYIYTYTYIHVNTCMYMYFYKEMHNYMYIYIYICMCHTVDGRWSQTSAVLSSPPHPQISMLPVGCALGAGGQKNRTRTQRKLYRTLCKIEIWGLGVYLVGICRVWFFCPSTVCPSGADVCPKFHWGLRSFGVSLAFI